MTADGYNQAIAITRKLAQARGVADQKVGPAYLALGIAKSLGEEVPQYAAEFGGKRFVSALSCVPTAASDELDQLPSLHPDAGLKSLLCGKLKPFREGSLDAGRALEILLADRSVREEIASLLGIALSGKVCNAGDLFRSYSKLVFRGYFIGAVRYGIGSNKKLPDYVTGEADGEFEEQAKKFNEEKEQVATDLYSAIGVDSYFRGLLKLYGRVGSDLLLAVLANELTPYSKTPQDGITVRELAWTLDPGNYHHFASEIASEVEALVEEYNVLSYVEHPFADYSPLQKTVVPRDATLGALCSFLARGDGDSIDLASG